MLLRSTAWVRMPDDGRQTRRCSCYRYLGMADRLSYERTWLGGSLGLAVLPHAGRRATCLTKDQGDDGIRSRTRVLIGFPVGESRSTCTEPVPHKRPVSHVPCPVLPRTIADGQVTDTQCPIERSARCSDPDAKRLELLDIYLPCAVKGTPKRTQHMSVRLRRVPPALAKTVL